jgi:Fe-S cluster assembly protein SufD
METLATPIRIEDEYSTLYNENIDLLSQDTASFIVKNRRDAMESFKKLGIPGRKNENFKYTDLQPYFRNSFKKQLFPKKISFELADVFHCDVPDLNTEVAVLLNGYFHDGQKPMKELPGGILVGSFAQASLQYPELVKKYYSTYADFSNDGLVALNTALSRDGFFMYVPEGVTLDKPIQVINMLMSDEPMFIQQRNLIILEKGASAHVVICDHTLSAQKFLSNNVTETRVGENAQFAITRLQNEHNGATQVLSHFIYQEANSKVTTNTITLHGGIVRNNLHVKLNGEGAEHHAFGLFLTDQGQHVDNYTYIEHAKPHCTSNQLFKGVLDDFSSGAFNGKILVARDAQKTLAYQKNNNILLTDDAKMNTRPQLEIYADDVKCSHGATVGQIDKEAMFYLQSRGIGMEDARLLLMVAFAEEIVDQIPITTLKERIEDLVAKRLKGELSRCHNCAMHCC